MLDAKHNGSCIKSKNRLDTKTRVQTLHMLCEGMSMRAISRITGASFNTVSKLMNPQDIARHPRNGSWAI